MGRTPGEAVAVRPPYATPEGLLLSPRYGPTPTGTSVAMPHFDIGARYGRHGWTAVPKSGPSLVEGSRSRLGRVKAQRRQAAWYGRPGLGIGSVEV